MKEWQCYKGFRDLDCWKKAQELRILVSELTKKFPRHELYALTAQVKRSSRSVTNNMAEGYGRFTYSDTRHFFIQSRGSLTETLDHMIIAAEEQYITKEELIEIEALVETTFKLTNGYISYLDRSKNENGSSK